MQTKVIYSLRIYAQLVKAGFQPITIMPNPKDSKYNCWIFEATPQFLEEFDKVVSGNA